MLLSLSTLVFLYLANCIAAFPAASPNTTEAFASQTDECNLANLKQLIFNQSLTSFVNLFQSQNRPTCYHWCTNACSWSPDKFPYNIKGDSINWQPACARHDFSWHNLKRYGDFNEDTKLAADTKLLDGMLELCGEHKACAEVSRDLYFPAVRKAGEPASNHLKPDNNTDCTIFPGCCANHSDPQKCGPQRPIPGQFKGDASCAVR